MKFRNDAALKVLPLVLALLFLTACKESKVAPEDIPSDSKSIHISVEVNDPAKVPATEKGAFAAYMTPQTFEKSLLMEKRFRLAYLISFLICIIITFVLWLKRWDKILSKTEGITFTQYKFQYKAKEQGIGSISHSVGSTLPYGTIFTLIGSFFILLLLLFNWFGEELAPYCFYFTDGTLVSKTELSVYWLQVLIAFPYGFFSLLVLGFLVGGIDVVSDLRIRVSIARANRDLGLTPIKNKTGFGWQLREYDNQIETLSKTIGVEESKEFLHQLVQISFDVMKTLVEQSSKSSYLYLFLMIEKQRNAVRDSILKYRVEEGKNLVANLKKAAAVINETQQLFNLTKSKVGSTKLIFSTFDRFQKELDEISEQIESSKKYLKESKWDEFHQAMKEVKSKLDRLYQDASGNNGSQQSQSTGPPYQEIKQPLHDNMSSNQQKVTIPNAAELIEQVQEKQAQEDEIRRLIDEEKARRDAADKRIKEIEETLKKGAI
jgi:hypothetical protein